MSNTMRSSSNRFWTCNIRRCRNSGTAAASKVLPLGQYPPFSCGSKIKICRGWLFLLIATAAFCACAKGPSVHSYLPAENLPQFLVKHLSLASFRNSLGPQRVVGETTFYELGFKQWEFAAHRAVFDGPNWHYGIQVLRQDDINGDGVADAVICFTDQAKEGSYLTVQPLLITRFSNATPAIALKYEVSGCKTYKAGAG